MTVHAFLPVVLAAMVLAAAASPLSVERVESGLRVVASLPRSTYDSSQVVEVSLTATNTGGAPVSVTFTSGQRFDLVIRRPRGDTVWRWSHDKAFIQVIQTLALQPGESLSFKIPWDQTDYQGLRVDPGPYEAVAVFLGATGAPREVRLPPLAFTILR
jgi:hypothetical protein